MIANPSAQQIAFLDFVRHGQGHGLGIARAGTGKTAICVAALECVQPGSSVLMLAFNASNRDTLLERVPSWVRVRSLHQLGRDTLLAYRAYASFRHDEDDAKGRDMAQLALDDTEIDKARRHINPSEARAARDFYFGVRDVVVQGMRLVKATRTQTREALLALIRSQHLASAVGLPPDELAGYISKATKASLDAWPRTDFDDEVWLPVHLGIGLRHYDYVFVDEIQDVTATQLQLALSAMRDGGRFFAVGDPAQALYSWRGAKADIFDSIKKDLNATEFPFSVSFRCPQVVVEHARQYVPEFTAHPNAPKGAIIDMELAEMLMQVKTGDVILSRTNAPLAQIGLDLNTNGVPAAVVGSADVGRSLAALVKRARRKTVTGLLEWLDKYLADEIQKHGEDSDIVAYATDRVETVKEFCGDGGTGDPGLVAVKIENFFAEQKKKAKGSVLLATVHRWKGQENDRVFLLEETFFNKRGDLQEEKNIHYVGLTRAKHSLFLVRGLYQKRQEDRAVNE